MPDRGDGGFRRHASSVFWLGLAEAAARGGMVVLQFLLARALGRESYGTFAYAYSLALIVVAAGGIGLLEAFVRKGAAGGVGVAAALSEFLPLRAVSAVVTLAVLAALALAHRPGSAVVFTIGLFVLFRALTMFLASSFRAAEVIWKEFALRCGEAAALLAVIFAAIRFRHGLMSVSLFLAAAAGVFLLLTVAAFRSLFPGFEGRWPRSWVSAAVRAAPLGLPALIGSFLLRTDVILIQRATGSAAATADYAAAVNIVLGAGLVPATISAALFPALSRRAAQTGARTIFAGVLGFLLLGGALSLLLATEAARIVRLAYGSEFGSAAAVLASLSPFLLFLAPTMFAATVLASRNAVAALAGIALIPLALKVAADLWLLPAGVALVPEVSTVLQAGAMAGAVLMLGLSRHLQIFRK